MHCTPRAATCACAAPGGVAPATGRTRLVVASTTRHTLTAVRAAATRAGAQVEALDGIVQVSAPDRAALFQAFDEGLTRPEKDEARALEVGEDDDTSLVAQALTAPSLAVQCAREREQPLGEALRSSASFHSIYQPIVDLTTGDVTAFEALLRGEVGGAPVMPGEMFAAAEEAGWLHVLDRIGREQAILGATGWIGGADLFVNFNPTSIYRPEVCLATTERAIGQAGLEMDQLVFEIVESHYIDALDHLLGVLAHYRSMGCRVAMDDMGAGYASLNSLAVIEPEVVKLDKELVQRLPDRTAAAVVRSIVSLSHDIGAIVIAECVETEAQLHAARDLGVDWAQGWYFARPSLRPREHPVAAVPSPAEQPAVAPWAPTGRQLDRLLRHAVQATTTGITVADAREDDQPLVFVNDAFVAMTGYDRDQVLGRNCRVLQGEVTDAQTRARIGRALAAGEPVQARIQNVRPDGTPWWNDLSITPVCDVDGRVTHFVGVQQDVTALVEAERCADLLAAAEGGSVPAPAGGGPA